MARGPREESKYFNADLAKQFTDFDIAKANRHLDNAGYSNRDKDGFRLRSDGERIRFTVEAPSQDPLYIPILELVREYWAEVGIDMQPRSEERSFFYERKAANLHDAAVYVGEYGLTYDALLDPRWYMPFSEESNYAIPWAAWYNSDGEQGQEPPSAAKEQMELYDQIRRTYNADEQDALFRSILEIARNEFWVLGIALPNQGYRVVADDLKNVPESIPNSFTYPFPAPSNLEQYYFDI